jgi:hypothetical protein
MDANIVVHNLAMLLVCLSGHGSELKAANVVVFNTIPTVHLSVIDKNTAESLRSRLPTELLPFAAVLTNNAEKRLIAYQLTWTVRMPDGTTFQQKSRVVQLQDLAVAGKERHAARSAAMDPGMSNVVYPFGYLGREEGPRLTHDMDALKRSASFLKLQQSTNVTVEVDAVIFEDGSFEGTDEGFVHATISSFDGEQSFFQEVLEASRTGKSESEIVAIAQHIVESPLETRPERQQFTSAKVARAREFLAISNSAGVATAIANIRTLYTRTVPKFAGGSVK